MVFHPHFISE